MSKKDKKPPDNTKSEREDAFNEADDYLFQDDPQEEENISSDRKYWEKYFEEEDEEMFQRRQRRIKEKGKVKPKFRDLDRE